MSWGLARALVGKVLEAQAWQPEFDPRSIVEGKIWVQSGASYIHSYTRTREGERAQSKILKWNGFPQEWGLTFIIPNGGRKILMGSRPAWTTEWDPVSKKNRREGRRNWFRKLDFPELEQYECVCAHTCTYVLGNAGEKDWSKNKK